MYGFFKANRMERWTQLFLATTALTSLTGFLFPNEHITPGIVIGIRSMIILALAAGARYGLGMRGRWRPAYLISAAIALYFNGFVFVVQSFEKVPPLRVLAPTQREPPFALAQLLVLILFVVATVFAVKRFRPGAPVSASDPATQKRAA